MDYQQYPQYAQPEPHAQPSFDQPYDPYYAAAYSQAAQAAQYDPSAAYAQQYYDYTSYAQPPPPGVEAAQLHYMAAPSPEFPQLTDFAGSSQGAGDPTQTGGSRGAFRGRGGRRGGRGNFGNFRGRGRGKGRGKTPGLQQQQPPPAPKPPKPPKQPKPHAWCDVCRVDCNSLEILEQHKAGKKHKRTVQRLQEYEAQQKQIAGYQSNLTLPEASAPVPAPVLVPIPIPELVPVSEPKPEPVSVVAEANLPVTQEQNVEVKKESQPEVSEVPQSDDSKRPRQDGYGLGSVYGYGNRFNTGFSRGSGRRGPMNIRGKRPRRFGEFQPWPYMPVQGPVPVPVPRVRPVVCTLCNVNCDTPAVFETHLSGKKHVARINKFQGPNTVFGPITVYIPPNQPSLFPHNAPEPIFYGLTTPELIQQHEMLVREEMDGEDEEGGKEENLDENKADNESKDLTVGNIKEEKESVMDNVEDVNQKQGSHSEEGIVSDQVDIPGLNSRVEEGV